MAEAPHKRGNSTTEEAATPHKRRASAAPEDPLATASITSVSPANLAQGATGVVQITGNKTNFTSASVVSFSGSGIAASAVTAVSPTSLTVQLTLDAAAQVGPCDVTVTTGGEVVTGVGMLTVDPQPTAFCSPDAAMRGTVQTIQINGQNTHFDATSVVSFAGGGIVVSAVVILSATTLRATITIDPSADLGTNHVHVTSGTEVAAGGSFTVEVNPALVKITSVKPGTTTQGTTGLAVQVIGQHTHFDATSVVSFSGSGIDIAAFGLLSETEMEATLNIDAAAPAGASDVTVTTGAEVAVGEGVFTVGVSTSKAVVLREAVNTFLRQNHVIDEAQRDICEEFIANVNQALRGEGSSTMSAVIVTVRRKP